MFKDFIPEGEDQGAIGKGGFVDFVPDPKPEPEKVVKASKPKKVVKKKAPKKAKRRRNSQHLFF